jgi:hypothetical protein
MARNQRSSVTANPNLNTSMLAAVKKGDPIYAQLFNDVLAAVNQLSRGNGLPSQVYAGPARGLIQLIIADVSEDDYLICNTWDGTTQGAVAIPVAKPYLLRNIAAWNGFTYAYSNPQTRVSTKTADSTTENQAVVPAYVVDDIIYAQAANWTNVDDATPSEMKMIDTNLDARMWMKSS